MKFAYGLPVMLLGVTNVMVLHQVAVALEPPQVNAIAKKITVRISGPEAGSGVIVKKRGNTYIVLTNWHVVDTPGTYTIQTQNGRRYQVSSNQVQRLPRVDLAVFQFQSNQIYETANIANSDKVVEGTTVYAAGWADTDAVCLQRCFQSRPGNLSVRLPNAKDGYYWIYTNIIKRGMSGGPVLDKRGRLVGINGRGIRDPRNGTTDFFAIPINTYVKLASAITPPPSRTSVRNPDTEDITLTRPITSTPLPKRSPTTTSTPTISTTGIRLTLAKTLIFRYGVSDVTVSPDGRLLAFGSWYQGIKIWDVATSKLLKTLTGHSYPIGSVAFSPDGRILASAETNSLSESFGSSKIKIDKSIKIWNVATGKQIKTLNGHIGSSGSGSITFSPNGRLLAFENGDKSIKIWDVATSKLLKTFTDHSYWIGSVAFSPDGRLLAFGSRDKSIKIWDVTTGKQFKTLTGHSSSIQSVVFSPDGRTLASGGSDERIKIWDVATSKLLRTFTVDTRGWIGSITFSPDGRILAFGGSKDKDRNINDYKSVLPPPGDSEDKSIKIWDIATGKQIKTLTGHNNFVFSPNSRNLVSWSFSNIKIWRLSGR
ncbi:MAG: trypsin-like peptidase domain-containing protein [Calothrix sp. MO_167.B12]|nr:trypsin-like peptidase domain-containing protein [Calothrix sp. MO_167.B12]